MSVAGENPAPVAVPDVHIADVRVVAKNQVGGSRVNIACGGAGVKVSSPQVINTRKVYRPANTPPAASRPVVRRKVLREIMLTIYFE